MHRGVTETWTAVDKAWVAGLLEARGWIGVVATLDARAGRLRCRAVLTVRPTDGQIADVLRRLLGHTTRGTPAPELDLAVSDADVAAAVEAVLPYLVSRVEQALDVLAFWQVMRGSRGGLTTTDLFEKLRAARVDIPKVAPHPVGLADDRPDAAWLAAIIDTLGYVGIERRKPTHLLVLSVANADERLVRRIHEVARCGDVMVRASKVVGRSPSWRWRASCANAVKVLTRIGPYLVSKKPHLAVAHRFDRTIHREGGRRRPLLESELRIREECAVALRTLNAP